MNNKNDMFPKLKKKLSNFIEDEEGTVLRSKAAVVGPLAVGAVVLMSKEMALEAQASSYISHSSHRSHTSHRSHVSHANTTVTTPDPTTTVTTPDPTTIEPTPEPTPVHSNHASHSNVAHSNHASHSNSLPAHSSHSSATNSGFSHTAGTFAAEARNARNN